MAQHMAATPTQIKPCPSYADYEAKYQTYGLSISVGSDL